MPMPTWARGPPPTILTVQNRAPRQALRVLNRRHRQHLIVNELMKDLSIGLPPGTPTTSTATLSRTGLTPQLTLTLKLSLERSNTPASKDFWQRQVSSVLSLKWHRGERMEEIVLQQTDILPYLTLGLPVTGDTHPWLTVLLDAVFDMAFRVAAEMKHHFAMPRPNELCPDIAPVIRTPSHGAFPSGHATEAFAAAAILAAVFPERVDHLRQMAARIAMNRCYAGVHYPVDQYAGAILGDVLGGLAVQQVFGGDPFTPPVDPLAPPWTFTGGGSAPAPTVEAFAMNLVPVILKKPAGPLGVAASPGILKELAGLIKDEL